jgi:hypothetical protein
VSHIELNFPEPKDPYTDRCNWVCCLHIVSDVAWLRRLVLYILYYLWRPTLPHVFTIDIICNFLQSMLRIITKVGLCYHIIKPLETEFNTNYISTYRKVNTAPLSYKFQLVNCVCVYREISVVWSESRTKHVNELCEQNTEFSNVKLGCSTKKSLVLWGIKMCLTEEDGMVRTGLIRHRME